MRVKIDNTYGKVPKTVMIGEGKLWVFSNGKMVKGTWSKSGKTDRIILKDASGNEIKLAPGNTWVELMPAFGSITVKEPPKPSPEPSASPSS